jgi:homoserine kinase
MTAIPSDNPVPVDQPRARETRAFAPATIANFAVGFDLLGLAVRPLDGPLLGDTVSIRTDPDLPESFVVKTAGPHAHDLPRDPTKNVVHAIVGHFLKGPGAPEGAESISVTLEKNLPVSSGLGGSASSVVAALTALNHHFGTPFTPEELLVQAGEAERFTSGAAHYDNVAPALLGGFCLLRGPGNDGVLQLPWPEDWVLVLVIPEFRIATRNARRVLPASVPLEATVRYSRHLALLVAALYRQDADLARRCLEDTLIEPVRAPLLPGFVEAKAAALAGGALGCSLSGSGPATFAVALGVEEGREIARGMSAAFERAGLKSSWLLAGVDPQGARVLP